MKERSTLGKYSAINYFMIPAGGIGEDPHHESVNIGDILSYWGHPIFPLSRKKLSF